MPAILLEANHIKKSFGDQTVLNIDQIRIYDGERIALIGENGAGKSTLLSILAREAEPDEGRVITRCPFAFIHQSGRAEADGTERMASEFHAPVDRAGLSGGEETRRRIAEALSENAPMLFADEPTTDLDAEGAQALQKHLLSYRGALLLVSHDRSLLNALCNRVWHLENGAITVFPGTYAEYQDELRRRRAFQQFEYDQYRAEQARLKALAQQKAEWAASVRKAPKRMGNSEARLHTHEYTNAVLRQSAAKKTVERRMERLEKKERPSDMPEISMTLGVARPVGAKTVLSVNVDSLTAGRRTLISRSRFSLPTGSRTALIGENGSGKTTLLLAVFAEPAPGTSFQGRAQLNPSALPGYFDQDHARALRLDATALENAMEDSVMSVSTARTVLARLNLKGDNVFKPVRVLSGGERAKIALAKLLLSDVNLLILDEPTNHLDVFTMEALETLLTEYGGTLLFVSHDRAFVSSVANRVIRISGGRLETFEGGVERMEEEERRDRNEEAVRTEIAALEMRMAFLATRMSAPGKGDRPERLSEEYDELAARLREMKSAAD